MKSTLALSSAALVAFARTADPIYATDNAEDISGQEWDSIVEEPDLSGTQSFTGRDVSSSYPGSAQKGWEVKLSVKEEVDNPESGSDDDYVVAHALSLSSPDGEDVEFDDSWKLCVHVFPVKPSGDSDWGAEYDTDCTGLVAPECVEDLKKNGRKKFGSGDCESYKITPSCLRDLEDRKGYTVTVDSDSASDLLGSNNTFFRRTGDAHNGDDEEHTALMGVVTQGYAVVNVFGSSDSGDDDSFPEVRCVLPDTVVAENAFDPTPDAASSMGKFAGWAALTGVAAFQLLL